LELAEGPDLVPLVRAGRDEEATRIIAQGLNTLHACSTGVRLPTPLLTLEDRFASLRRKAEEDLRQGTESMYVLAWAVAKRLLESPVDRCVLHGDIHHGNFHLSLSRGWLALDPKGLIGERSYDVANALMNPVTTPQVTQSPRRFRACAEIFSSEMGLELTRVFNFAFAHACLSANWSLEDGEDPSPSLRVAEIAKAACGF
jgi:streptomycin 6-kinase